jgi:hypothetical protein
MPVALRNGPYSFLFFAIDRQEPSHVHVRRDRQTAKFWLEPLVRLARNSGFKPHELTEIERIILDNHGFLLEAWHVFFRR